MPGRDRQGASANIIRTPESFEHQCANLKFAVRSGRVRSELQIQKAHWSHLFARVAEDSEIRSELSTLSGEFPNRHTSRRLKFTIIAAVAPQIRRPS